MWRWHPGATEPQDELPAHRLSGSAGGSYYRLPDDRDPESLSLHFGLFTDAPAEISPFQKADVVFLVLYLILLLLYAAAVLLSLWIAVVREHVLAVVAGNAALLVASGLVEVHLRKQIRDVRRQGFLKLSKELTAAVGLPSAVVAYGTAGALLVLLWQGEVEKFVKVPALLLLRGWILAEVVAAGACTVWYVCKLRQHNSRQEGPDAVRLLASVLRAQELEDVKYTGGKLAEEQASLLQYQQQNLIFLSREIVRLRESLSKYEQTEEGDRPDVDAAALLAVREQELRAVTAERDQLQGEVRLARRDISERNAEIAKTTADVENLLEENARLRAMLDEWSTHAAKVELALETERLANVELRKAHTSSPQSDSS